MDYFKIVLRDLADAGTLETLNRPAGPDRALSANASERYIAALKADGLNCAIQVALATTLANGLARGQACDAVEATFRLCFASPPLLLLAATDQLLKTVYPFGAFACTQEYLARFQFAQRLTELWLQSPAGHTGALSPVDTSCLADAWQHACRSALAFNTTMADILKKSGSLRLNANETRTLELLTLAAGGQCPCWDQDGSLSIAGWAERRTFKRTPIDVAISILAGTEKSCGRTIDISETGIGFVAKLAARPGDVLEITLSGLQPLLATMEWNSGNRYGARFEQPVSNILQTINA